MANYIDYLKQLLVEEGLVHLDDSLEKLTSKRLDDSPFKKAAKEIYEELGGIGAELPPIDYSFDIELMDKGVIIDGDIHFNKYRIFTFRSDLYDMIDGFPLQNYRRFCRTYEKECLKAASYGSMWSSNHAKKFFGESNDAGDLGLNGSNEWKLRAYQDFIVDLSSMIFDYKIFRISIYDNVLIGGKLIPLKELLMSRKKENEKYIISFFRKKISPPKSNGDHLFKKS